MHDQRSSFGKLALKRHRRLLSNNALQGRKSDDQQYPEGLEGLEIPRACPPGDEDLTATASRLSTAAATGCSQTKIVLELLMHRAQKMGNDFGGEIVVPRMTIVHPGIIIRSRSSGVANPDDFSGVTSQQALAWAAMYLCCRNNANGSI